MHFQCLCQKVSNFATMMAVLIFDNAFNFFFLENFIFCQILTKNGPGYEFLLYILFCFSNMFQTSQNCPHGSAHFLENFQFVLDTFIFWANFDDVAIY